MSKSLLVGLLLVCSSQAFSFYFNDNIANRINVGCPNTTSSIYPAPADRKGVPEWCYEFTGFAPAEKANTISIMTQELWLNPKTRNTHPHPEEIAYTIPNLKYVDDIGDRVTALEAITSGLETSVKNLGTDSAKSLMQRIGEERVRQIIREEVQKALGQK